MRGEGERDRDRQGVGKDNALVKEEGIEGVMGIGRVWAGRLSLGLH